MALHESGFALREARVKYNQKMQAAKGDDDVDGTWVGGMTRHNLGLSSGAIF